MVRPVKPTILKVVQGTARKCRINKNEPKPPVGVPRPPDYLDGEALRAWNRVGKVLADMGVMTTADSEALEAYCDTYARWREYCSAIDNDGPFITTEKGNLIQHPAVGAANKALHTMVRLMSEFGITPAARSKVSGKEQKPDNPFAKFAAK